ncbi:MAG: ATP-binding cassette domain-containing protein [Firmicutes bacterium]|nr:ATP-binding cassette domain-containing protein [Bacillota bacterium]
MMKSIEKADPAIVVTDLEKTYRGGIEAVKRISFRIERGEIFGFLGPNGAGKSTTIMMLTTLIRPTGGSAIVNGLDIVKDSYRVRTQLGYVSQELAVDDNLTGHENLVLQARFYHIPRSQIASRIDEVLKLVGLGDRAHDRVEFYSGGMRKRLDIACGLIHRPSVLFLDEPTLGLDIQTRHEIWHYIERLRSENKMTIFLTTHYMDEADALCDRIAIIDRGVIKAIDVPGTLKDQLGGDVIFFRFADAPQSATASALAALQALPDVKELSQRSEGEHVVVARNGDFLLPQIFDVAQDNGVKIESVTLKRPTLDDVYLSHTGRGLRDEVGGSGEAVKKQMFAMRRARR